MPYSETALARFATLVATGYGPIITLTILVPLALLVGLSCRHRAGHKKATVLRKSRLWSRNALLALHKLPMEGADILRLYDILTERGGDEFRTDLLRCLHIAVHPQPSLTGARFAFILPPHPITAQAHMLQGQIMPRDFDPDAWVQHRGVLLKETMALCLHAVIGAMSEVLQDIVKQNGGLVAPIRLNRHRDGVRLGELILGPHQIDYVILTPGIGNLQALHETKAELIGVAGLVSLLNGETA